MTLRLRKPVSLHFLCQRSLSTARAGMMQFLRPALLLFYAFMADGVLHGLLLPLVSEDTSVHHSRVQFRGSRRVRRETA